jgi:hypothetical protein
MHCVEFEPTNPVFERAKIFHALDRAANVIGSNQGLRLVNRHRCWTFSNYVFENVNL